MADFFQDIRHSIIKINDVTIGRPINSTNNECNTFVYDFHENTLYMIFCSSQLLKLSQNIYFQKILCIHVKKIWSFTSGAHSKIAFPSKFQFNGNCLYLNVIPTWDMISLQIVLTWHVQNFVAINSFEFVQECWMFSLHLIRPISQIPQCICQISHNAPFLTEMCTFL